MGCAICVSAALQLPKRHVFARRTLKPFWQLNSRFHNAFITVLRDITSSSALSKHCKIFLGHKQSVLGQLWHLVFQIIHYLRDRKSTRLNSSHEWISYAVFCLKTKII